MQKLRSWMDEHGVKQTQLAAVLEVEQPTVWGWLQGHSIPRTKTLLKLAEYTGIPVAELLEPAKKKRKSH